MKAGKESDMMQTKEIYNTTNREEFISKSFLRDMSEREIIFDIKALENGIIHEKTERIPNLKDKISMLYRFDIITLDESMQIQNVATELFYKNTTEEKAIETVKEIFAAGSAYRFKIMTEEGKEIMTSKTYGGCERYYNGCGGIYEDEEGEHRIYIDVI